MKNLKVISILFVFAFFISLEGVNAQTVTPEITVIPTTTSTPTVAPTDAPIPTNALPGVPQGLSATVINDDRIDISWNRSANSTAYELFRNNEMVAVVSSLFYSDNGLEPETSYSYKVRAYDGSNYSAFSTTVSATTKSETDDSPNPTIPEGPDIEQKTPSVVEKFGFITLGTESYGYTEVPKFDAGEDLTINGRTESYADIEVIVKSDPKSYFAKADEDGFWVVKVDTTSLEPGMHTFLIKISADDFPEIYESEEYTFEVSEKPVEEAVTEDNSFSNRVRFIAIGLIILVIVIFVVGIILAKKKGLFKKLSGDSKKDSGEALPTPPQATFSEDMIQIDDESSSKPETPPVEVEQVTETQANPTAIIPPVVENSQPVVSNTQSPPTETIGSESAEPVETLDSMQDLGSGAQVQTNETQITTDNEDNKLGSSMLDDQPLEDDSEQTEGVEDSDVAHSVDEIDTDGVSVEVEDLGVNPYADVVRKSYAQEMPDEENLPVMDLSSGETSVENSFSVNETDLQQQQPVGDYSSTTPVINNGSGGISSQDNMVSGVTNIPATSIGTENNIQEPNPNS
ncbi:MAG TPA: fibronectin type III domain-containing protein [Candidatus Dojkabacteria bacterium]|nr:fibronectin type III domain-containing protein [Candidatus Dojkabacteria bacterium]HRP50916.1 fibronectin type III domain-containing protein [Candidatus Dojkabacteria bacterium]